MIKVGARIKWRSPLDADYSYGTVTEIDNGRAIVRGTGYYKGVLMRVHLRYIEKLDTGGKKGGRSKKYRKRSTS